MNNNLPIRNCATDHFWDALDNLDALGVHHAILDGADINAVQRHGLHPLWYVQAAILDSYEGLEQRQAGAVFAAMAPYARGAIDPHPWNMRPRFHAAFRLRNRSIASSIVLIAIGEYAKAGLPARVSLSDCFLALHGAREAYSPARLRLRDAIIAVHEDVAARLSLRRTPFERQVADGLADDDKAYWTSTPLAIPDLAELPMAPREVTPLRPPGTPRQTGPRGGKPPPLPPRPS